MKYSECDERQKKAWSNIKWAANDFIFGIMNGCLDTEKGSDEYNSYLNTLKNLEELKDTVYQEATTNVYREGSVYFGALAESMVKDIRFCGKEFLMKTVNHYCTKFQQEALSELGEI